MVTSLRALTNKLPRTVYLQVRSQPPQPPGQQPPGSQPPNGSTQLVSLVCQVFQDRKMCYDQLYAKLASFFTFVCIYFEWRHGDMAVAHRN